MIVDSMISPREKAKFMLDLFEGCICDELNKTSPKYLDKIHKLEEMWRTVSRFYMLIDYLFDE